jgi:hypothetical protein
MFRGTTSLISSLSKHQMSLNTLKTFISCQDSIHETNRKVQVRRTTKFSSLSLHKLAAPRWLQKLIYWKTVNLSLSTPWKRTRGEDLHLHSFVTPALDGVVSGQHHVPSALSWGRKLGYHWGLDGPPQTEWTILEKRKLSCPCRDSSPQPSNPQPIVITTNYTNMAAELGINKLRTSSLKHQNWTTHRSASWKNLQYLVSSIKLARQPVPTAEEEACMRYF